MTAPTVSPNPHWVGSVMGSYASKRRGPNEHRILRRRVVVTSRILGNDDSGGGAGPGVLGDSGGVGPCIVSPGGGARHSHVIMGV